MHLLLWLVPVSVCSLLARFHSGPAPDFSDTRSVFLFRNGVWTAAPQLDGGVHGVEVSPAGLVWTLARTRGGFARLNGASWTSYGPKDLGTRTNWVRGGFALYGEEVWGATPEGVVHFDGQKWRLYPEALKTRQPLQIVAGRSGVWVTDDDGNLSHFEGSKWTIQDLSSILLAARQNDQDDYELPAMALTEDGHLWLRWHGLWHQKGDQWQQVQPTDVDLSTAYLIGQDGERIWLWLSGTNEMAAITSDGKVAGRYSVKDLGIAAGVTISRVTASEGRIWIASQAGLLAFDGTRWRNIGRPPGTVVVTDVAAGPDGSAWLVGESRPLIRVARWVAGPLAACAGALIAIGLVIAMWLRGRAENRLAADEALVRAAGQLPGLDPAAGNAEIGRQARSMYWKFPLALVAFPFVAFAISAVARLVQHRRPGQPMWLCYTVVLAPITLAGLGIWLVKSRRHAGPSIAPPSTPSHYGQVMWAPAKWILYIAIFGYVSSRTQLNWIERSTSNSTIAYFIRLAIAIVVITLVASARDLVADFLVKKAWRRGDYDRALRNLRTLGFGRPTTGMWRLEGLTHALAGHSATAEECFRRALAKGHSARRSTQASCLGCLGETLIEQGRYEEARRCLEGAVEMDDSNGCARVGIAELLLAQGSEPQEALDLIDEAMRVTKGQIGRRLEGGRRAIRAWALALLGRRHEAEQAIEQALSAPGGKLRATQAMRHWAAGMALIAMERTGKAIDQFRAARDADPNGKYGGMAAQQLKQLSVWGQ